MKVNLVAKDGCNASTFVSTAPPLLIHSCMMMMILSSLVVTFVLHDIKIPFKWYYFWHPRRLVWSWPCSEEEEDVEDVEEEKRGGGSTSE